MTSTCSDNQCDPFFADKRCKCYTRPSGHSPREEQICAYMENNVLYQCDSGCCAGKCPSHSKCEPVMQKLPDARVKDRDTIVYHGPAQVKKLFRFDDLFRLTGAVIISLLLLSTLALFSPVTTVVVLAVILSLVWVNKTNLKLAMLGSSVDIQTIWQLSSPFNLISLLLPRS